ncbi:MAG: hypothetical protein AAGF30_12855 [Pseudomonadota bacterium]
MRSAIQFCCPLDAEQDDFGKWTEWNEDAASLDEWLRTTRTILIHSDDRKNAAAKPIPAGKVIKLSCRSQAESGQAETIVRVEARGSRKGTIFLSRALLQDLSPAASSDGEPVPYEIADASVEDLLQYLSQQRDPFHFIVGQSLLESRRAEDETLNEIREIVRSTTELEEKNAVLEKRLAAAQKWGFLSALLGVVLGSFADLGEIQERFGNLPDPVYLLALTLSAVAFIALLILLWKGRHII